MPHAIAPRIEAVSSSVAGLVGEAGQGPVEQAVRVTSLGEFQQLFGGPQPGQDLYLGTSQFFASGGRQAWVVRLGGGSMPALRRALSALDAADDLGLLCVPGLSAGRELAAGAAYARGRRAFFIGDPAASRRATLDAVRTITAANAGHAAMYVPRLRVPDPVQPSRTRLFGASASVAGLLARTDRDRGVWAVAAGTSARLAGAVGLASAIDDPTAANLRARGLNVIRAVPGHGIVAWGARTVGGQAEEWKYIPVRRLALFIEESLYRGLEWTVFEPNDEPTWTLARRQAEAFLEELYRQGAFAGETPEASYIVRCGQDTMTQNDLNRGNLIVEVGVAPLRPAEFVNFRIQRPRP